MARDIVGDIGPEAASASGGLQELAGLSLDHSENSGHNLFKRAGLTLPVPMTTLGEDDADQNFPIIRLRHWAQFLADTHNLHILVGLQKPHETRERHILTAFWQHYRELYPEHGIFKHFDANLARPDSTFPVVFHGDEGRSRRRIPFLVTNYHSPIGRGTVSARTTRPQRYIKLRPNFLGATQTTRFLHSAVPRKLYQKDTVFQAIMEDAANEAVFMVHTGISQAYTNRKVWMCCLNVCGDWSWLHKCGQLCRSYNNVPKKLPNSGVLANVGQGICHRCCAGQDQVPWEAIHQRDPAWLHTRFSESAFVSVPPFCKLHHNPGEEEGLWAYDVFHAYHLGLGKSFVGSCLALLADEQPARNIDDKFKLLEHQFFTWCRANGESPQVTRVTKELIQWPARTDYPNGSWYKASVTTTFMKYLEATLTANVWPGEPMLVKAGEAAVAINRYFRELYNADAFIPPTEAVALAEQGLRFLRRFAWLGSQAMLQGRRLWLLTPKAHILHHLMLEDTLMPAREGKAPMNVLCFSCQQDEDFVGRPSRLSRRTDPRLVSRRCIQRHLESSYAEFVKAGYIKPQTN